MTFDIVEKFFTLSGEAPRAGQPMYLVRFSGCNLDCSYCDTIYRNEINQSLTFDELVEDIQTAINSYPSAFVLLTGGEPLLGERQAGIINLAQHLPHISFYVETNGSIVINDLSLTNLRYVVDWKCESSNQANSFNQNNLDRMRSDFDCIKFVVDSQDLKQLSAKIAAIKTVNPDLKIFLSPQWGSVELDELAAFIVDQKLDVGLSLQLHKIIWGNKRGV